MVGEVAADSDSTRLTVAWSIPSDVFKYAITDGSATVPVKPGVAFAQMPLIREYRCRLSAFRLWNCRLQYEHDGCFRSWCLWRLRTSTGHVCRNPAKKKKATKTKKKIKKSTIEMLMVMVTIRMIIMLALTMTTPMPMMARMVRMILIRRGKAWYHRHTRTAQAPRGLHAKYRTLCSTHGSLPNGHRGLHETRNEAHTRQSGKRGCAHAFDAYGERVHRQPKAPARRGMWQ